MYYLRESVTSLLKDEEAPAMLSFSFLLCPPPSPFLVGSVGSAIVPFSG